MVVVVTLVSLARFRILQWNFVFQNFEGFAPLSSIPNAADKKSTIIYDAFYLTCIFFPLETFRMFLLSQVVI